jgi:hypothetical protein
MGYLQALNADPVVFRWRYKLEQGWKMDKNRTVIAQHVCHGDG